MSDLAKLVDDLSKLTVIEAAELAKMLEEKWGVSAAAPVAVAAAPAAGAAAPPAAAPPPIGIAIGIAAAAETPSSDSRAFTSADSSITLMPLM